MKARSGGLAVALLDAPSRHTAIRARREPAADRVAVGFAGGTATGKSGDAEAASRRRGGSPDAGRLAELEEFVEQKVPEERRVSAGVQRVAASELPGMTRVLAFFFGGVAVGTSAGYGMGYVFTRGGEG